MRADVLRYRVMAYLTGVVLMVLCFIGVPLQVFAGDDAVESYVGTIHGLLYIIYLVTAYLLARRLRLAIGPTVVLLLAGTVPVLTFVVERWVTRRFINPALRAGPGEAAAADQAPAQPRSG